MTIKARLALLAATLFLLLFFFPVVPARGAEESPRPAAAEPAPTGLRATGTGWGSSLVRLGTSTVLVLGLAGACVFCLSRLQRFKVRPGGRRLLSLVETLPLGARRRLHLARVGERLILLAETDRDISLLMELETEDPPAEETLPAPSPAQIPFGRVLRNRAAQDGGS